MKPRLSYDEKQRLFGDSNAAREYIERLHWPHGPVCPHCGSKESYRISAKDDSQKPARAGLLKCKSCRKQFTVTVNTIFEASHIPLNKWLHAIYKMCASKKGVSAHQLHRELGITYKSAWFMVHRIRHAMHDDSVPIAKMLGTIEADETYVGGERTRQEYKDGIAEKKPVFTLIQRYGDARSFHVDNVTGDTLKRIIGKNVMVESDLMTDQSKVYNGLRWVYASHQTVNHHKKEYVRGIVHVNFAESYFSLLKRGIIGTFHHVSKTHLQRYLHEFDFRWNGRKQEDSERMAKTVMQIGGKRLMYKN